MDRLKKLAGIINEDQDQGLMNRINKVENQTVKKMLSDIAVTITDIKGFVMDMEETVRNEYKFQNKEFIQDATHAHGAIDDLVRRLEAYVKNTYIRRDLQ